MALQKTVTYRGITIQNTYIRVASYEGNKDRMFIQVGFSATNSDDYFDMLTYEIIPRMDGGNPIKQAYEHLKTLPEFAGAADV